MRWLSYRADGRASFGIVLGDGVVDAPLRFPEFDTLKDLLASSRLDEVGAELATDVVDHALSDIRYQPVVPRPDKIFCVGQNYRAHRDEMGGKEAGEPTIFVRFAASQMGHEQPMIRPKESQRLDFEGEIALIIGEGGRRISREHAMEHVAGFSCYNDGSVRDYQRHTSQFTPGKNFVGTGGFGPWMMTPDEVGEISALEITTRLNGEVMQNATAELLLFDFPKLIEYCSTFTELAPGDVIVTGTPSGVGAARNPPVFMDEGDVIEVEVKPIGTLRNRVIVG